MLLGATAASAQTAPSSAATPEAPPAPATSPAASATTLSLASLPDQDSVAALLWERSPEFASARARVASARSDLVRAGLIPNPELDLGANTLPLGSTNPPGLNRWTEVPNYGVGLSEQFELGKRGPRKDAARATLASTALDVQAQLRARTYDLLERAAEVATAEVRVAELEKLAADAARLTELQRARAQHGETAGLDADRAALEEAQLQGQLAEEHNHLTEALLNCSQTVGLACTPFGSREAASQFLTTRLARTLAPVDVQQRPDLRSLEAQQLSAKSALTLARRRWIPDPTLRVGYLRDQFVISGNQRDSLGVNLTIPLPFFDHGQADALAASATAEAAERARAQLTAQAGRDLTALTTQRQSVETRRERVRTQTLPQAANLVQRLEAAVKAGGASMLDLLFARRTYGQLVLDAADLDLAAFRLSVSMERVRGAGPKPPGELAEHF
jgi:outer membrane protein, heavy metal efflux system